MEEIIFESLYDPEQLQPIIDLLTSNNETLQQLLQQTVSTKVYGEWIIGLLTACFSLLIVIIFAVYFSNMK